MPAAFDPAQQRRRPLQAQRARWNASSASGIGGRSETAGIVIGIAAWPGSALAGARRRGLAAGSALRLRGLP